VMFGFKLVVTILGVIGGVFLVIFLFYVFTALLVSIGLSLALSG